MEIYLNCLLDGVIHMSGFGGEDAGAMELMLCSSMVALSGFYSWIC
jgi:hypothetical protein